MEPNQTRRAGYFHELAVTTVLLAGLGGFAGAGLADQVEMKSGDRYVGRVSAVDGDKVVLQSETLGTLRLARSKVSTISFGPVAPAGATNTAQGSNPAVLGPAARTNGTVESPAMFKQLAANTNLVQQVQAQFLAGAGPEANAKFNELLSGLLSGKLSVGDIRAQAATAADQLRAARKELGDDVGFALDGYLAILDHFLKQTDSGETGGATPKTSTPSNNGGKAEEE